MSLCLAFSPSRTAAIGAAKEDEAEEENEEEDGNNDDRNTGSAVVPMGAAGPSTSCVSHTTGGLSRLCGTLADAPRMSTGYSALYALCTAFKGPLQTLLAAGFFQPSSAWRWSTWQRSSDVAPCFYDGMLPLSTCSSPRPLFSAAPQFFRLWPWKHMILSRCLDLKSTHFFAPPNATSHSSGYASR
jgi:hypothetical protein